MDTKKLRNAADATWGEPSAALNDAADEIDRLRDRMQGAHETIKALTTERDAARAEVERIGAEYTAATAQANATLDKYRDDVERANVAARDARVEAERWSAADSAALAAVTADHGILLAEVDEANTALDEAGEPRDVGEGALSLASRIARLTTKVAALREAVEAKPLPPHDCSGCRFPRWRSGEYAYHGSCTVTTESIFRRHRTAWPNGTTSGEGCLHWAPKERPLPTLTPASEPEKEDK